MKYSNDDIIIVGVSANHNASVTLAVNGSVIFHVEEERLTGLKRDSEPFKALMEVAKYTNRIDHLVLTDVGPSARTRFFHENLYGAFLRKLGIDIVNIVDLCGKHHLCHAANTYYNSPFEDAVAVIIDGAGSFLRIPCEGGVRETESIFRCIDTTIQVQHTNAGVVREGNVPKRYRHIDVHNTAGIGKVYSRVSDFVGFGRLEDGKTMGMSAYGSPNRLIPPLLNRVGNLLSKFSGPLCTTDLPVEWKEYPADLCYRVQIDSERASYNYVKKAIGLNPDCMNICIGGGYGLNVVNNYKLIKAFPNHTFWFEPTCNDAGNSIGAVHYQYSVVADARPHAVKDYYLGLSTSLVLPELPGSVTIQRGTQQQLNKTVANIIDSGDVVVLFQGRSEAGPRALGHRSFLANPTSLDGKRCMNNIKHREHFRPFACSILEEYINDYFVTAGVVASPHMMVAFPTTRRAEIPAVVHIDGTVRIQTVGKTDDAVYRAILTEFYEVSGCPLLMNTSFNKAGKPLVESITDAINTLVELDVTYLYIPELGVILHSV